MFESQSFREIPVADFFKHAKAYVASNAKAIIGPNTNPPDMATQFQSFIIKELGNAPIATIRADKLLGILKYLAQDVREAQEDLHTYREDYTAHLLYRDAIQHTLRALDIHEDLIEDVMSCPMQAAGRELELSWVEDSELSRSERRNIMAPITLPWNIMIGFGWNLEIYFRKICTSRLKD